jgi:primosomal protein N'
MQIVEMEAKGRLPELGRARTVYHCRRCGAVAAVRPGHRPLGWRHQGRSWICAGCQKPEPPARVCHEGDESPRIRMVGGPTSLQRLLERFGPEATVAEVARTLEGEQ